MIGKKLEVIYEDTAILVCRKMAGVGTQSARAGQQDMVSLIKNYRAKKKEEPYVGLIHRLDQPVEGIMVFAKDRKAAADLSRQVAQKGADKYYLAVVMGCFQKKEDILEHYLVRDGKTNLSNVTGKDEPEARLARLSYKVLSYDEDRDLSLLRVKLDTGRHHQIRVQMAAIGHPLLGDQKYNPNPGEGNVALCSYKIGFVHPVTKKKIHYTILPENPLFAGFNLTDGLDN